MRGMYVAGLWAAASIAAPAMSAVSLQTFSNTQSILVPGTGKSGPANPYPSTIEVSGLVGLMTGLTVTLTDFSHTRVGDVGIGLIAPDGTGIWLFNGTSGAHGITDLTFTFSDLGSAKLNAQTVSGTYKPGSVFQGTQLFSDDTPLVTTLAGFDGIDPNGTWQLLVRDYASSYNGQPNIGGTGQIACGWSLSFNAEAPSVPEPATWGMMVFGFGIAGGAMRRRPQVAARLG